jgi:hypothetical protein
MKAITSKEKLLKALKKNSLITCGRNIWYLSDFHKSSVGQSVANRVISEGLVEQTTCGVSWFEIAYKLKK